ncbi:Spy/CpxP family protein refolding chaperone [Caulobacter vibrioides]|uniref:Amelogenin/CpxP-related protein n=1 Tax=Caulobacter vibrioides (strain NA1000 / CB15N) TaxID=565050 RepID=A0A0H3J1T3_CAUVN|nr:Spy/CpxP family protein refolding chaperone [Caulobacter vibrioides]YP_009020569.1 amelogenin/CpxP-related protein [Caulobacter vibrioides NA1000]AHI88600.1 amelogenin/CpxP-related protein [Caulobacter vibrioides NA1000]ATC30472.1 hypothetical protein CA607_19680 [Caulobacter vibrioides]QXZ52006.1 Spy/CpxP family protein refolding chaperone [Caulobacter vibrioides]
MRKTSTRLAVASAALSTLIAGAAFAQVPTPPAPPAPPPPPEAPLPPLPPLPPMPIEGMMAMAGPGMDMMVMRHGRSADPEKRAQRLRDVLQLRPDQDGALKAFVEATTPKIEVKREVVKKEKGDKADGDKMEWTERTPPTTLERLDRMTKAADAMKKRAEATRAFYTALTPSQQKTFDVLGMGEDGMGGGERVFVHRFDTKGPAMFKGGDRKVILQRKVG